MSKQIKNRRYVVLLYCLLSIPFILFPSCSEKDFRVGGISPYDEFHIIPLSDSTYLTSGVPYLNFINTHTGNRRPLGIDYSFTIDDFLVGEEQAYLLHGDDTDTFISSLRISSGEPAWQPIQLPDSLGNQRASLYESDTAVVVKVLKDLYAYSRESGRFLGHMTIDSLDLEDIPPVKDWSQKYLLRIPEVWNRTDWIIYQDGADTVFVNGPVMQGGSGTNWQYTFDQLRFIQGKSKLIGVVSYAGDSLQARVIDPADNGRILYQHVTGIEDGVTYAIDGHFMGCHSSGAGFTITDLQHNEIVYQDASGDAKEALSFILHNDNILFVIPEGVLRVRPYR